MSLVSSKCFLIEPRNFFDGPSIELMWSRHTFSEVELLEKSREKAGHNPASKGREVPQMAILISNISIHNYLLRDGL